MTGIQQVISETRTRRDEARVLLDALIEAKSKAADVGEATLPDAFAGVTGESSMDRAIGRTRRLIDSFNRVLDELESGLDERDLALLAEITREASS
jgi:hypothetical protein